MICWKALQSDPNPLHQVLFTATQLAQNSGAAEIGIDHLLAALDCPSRPEEELVSLFEQVPENGGGFFYNTEWMRLSKGVVAAITPIGGFEGIANVEVVRNALVEARKRGER
jgi:hypothetical protein